MATSRQAWRYSRGMKTWGAAVAALAMLVAGCESSGPKTFTVHGVVLGAVANANDIVAGKSCKYFDQKLSVGDPVVVRGSSNEMLGTGKLASDDVTTPPPKGGGFSLSRSFTKAQSEPEDVPRCVGVGVRGMSAPLTQKRFTAAVLGSHMPAGMTGARGVAGVDLDDFDNSFFRFLSDQFEQHPPTRVEDAPVETGLLSDVRAGLFHGSRRRTGHIPDLEILDHDQVIGIDVGPRDFVQVVLPYVLDLAVQGRHTGNGLAASVRSALLAGQVALSVREPVLCGSQRPDVVHEPAVAVGDQVSEPTIQPDSSAGERFGLYGDADTDHVDVPVSPRPGDRELLDGAAHRSVKFHLDVSDTLHPNSVVEPLATVAVDKGHGVEPAGGPEARIAGLLALLGPREERGERLVQPPQCLLLAGKRPAPVLLIGPDVFELAGLFAVAYRVLALGVCVTSFLKRGVVDVAVVAEHLPESRVLTAGRVQAVTEDAVHSVALAPGTLVLGVDVPLHGVSTDCPDRSDEVGTRPQSRKSGTQRRKLLPQSARGEPLELVGDERRRIFRPGLHEQVNVVGHHLQGDDPPIVLISFESDQFIASCRDVTDQNLTTVLGTPHDVIPDVPDAARSGSNCTLHNYEYTYTRGLMPESAVPIPPSPEGDSPLGTF